MPVAIASPVESAKGPVIISPEGGTRFTLDGSDELELQLARACENVLAGIKEAVPPRKLEALLLGGGYGRGEGGVLKTESGDRPYNDLEFYVFIRGNNWLNERRFGGSLHHLAHRLAPGAGVEVELKVISSAKLRRSPTSMFYYDLVTRHHQLHGDREVLGGCEQHGNAGNIPLSEATRLLMNRCTGLLLAQERLERACFTAEDADFVQRNLAKAQLAFGDAVLTIYGQYHWSCLRRYERIRRLPEAKFPWLDTLRHHHEAGVKFKLHPHVITLTQAMLLAQHKSVVAFARKVWLWLESCRLGSYFTSVQDYAFSQLDKCPDTNPWRNRLINAKAFGPTAFFSQRGRRHPRERIFNALALLLWEPLKTDSEIWSWLSGELRWPIYAGTDPIKAYQERWRRLS
jgi:hypothetical protein